MSTLLLRTPSFLPPQFLSARAAGAAGDGQTDDTAALNQFLAAAAAANKIAYFECRLTTLSQAQIKVPAGSRIFGEVFPVILSSGTFFADYNNPAACWYRSVNLVRPATSSGPT